MPRYQGPVFCVNPYKSSQGNDYYSSQCGAHKDKPTAQKAHNKNFQREGPEHQIREYRSFNGNKESTGNPGEKGCDYKPHQLLFLHIDTDCFASFRIIPDSLKSSAKG